MGGYTVSGSQLEQLLLLAPGGFQRALDEVGFRVEMYQGAPVALHGDRRLSFIELAGLMESMPDLQMTCYQAVQDITRGGTPPDPRRFPSGPEIPHPAERLPVTAADVRALIAHGSNDFAETVRRVGMLVDATRVELVAASGERLSPEAFVADIPEGGWLQHLLTEARRKLPSPQ